QIARERPQDIRRITAKIRNLQTAVTTPGFIVMAFIAQPLIGFLYDDRYATAGIFLSLMAMNGAIGALPMAYQNAMLALGDSRSHAFVMGASSVLKIGGTIIGFY